MSNSLKMITFPNAKINIGLRIVEKRPDNYHNLETIFYPVALRDALEVVSLPPVQSPSPALPEGEGVPPPLEGVRGRLGDIKGGVSGIVVDTPFENNLIAKAYRLLQKDFPLPAVDVHLHKHIPFGAGLGGGSSDAAFMLKMLNEMFSLKIPTEKLEQYASMLGADCAFFVRNKPVLATGIGNVFQEIDLNLEKYHIAIVKPPVFVSTAQAYASVKPPKSPSRGTWLTREASPPEGVIGTLGASQELGGSLSEIVQKPISEWKNYLFNDFEQGVFAQFPVIAEVKNELYNCGALYASMSGSGSAVYGIFEEKIELKNIFPKEYFIFL